MSKTYDELRNAEEFRRATHILKGLRIKGQISGSEDVVVDGTVDGPIQLSQGLLTIAEKGIVNGNVNVRETIVHGALTGNLQARDRVKITPTGSVVGDLTTGRIVIDDGGQYKGTIAIGDQDGMSSAAKA
jgi:cytoskeletal protein CcmA (bactofilin family)